MTVRVAAIEVSHWHALYDPAYLSQLAAMPDVALVGLHDPDPALAAHRAAAVGGPPTFTDVEAMLAATRPDFVLALGRHSGMAATAHLLLDRGLPFVMEKPMGLNAAEVAGVAAKARATGGFAAVPMPFRQSAFCRQARAMLAAGRFGPLSHVYIRQNRFTPARYAAWGSPWMADPAQAGGGCLRNLGPHGLDMFLQLTGEDAAVVAAQTSARVHGQAVEDYASVLLRSATGVLGTLDVGTAYPRRPGGDDAPLPARDRLPDGADSEWTICGRDALLTSKDGTLRIVTADAEETLPSRPERPFSYLVLEEAIRRWRAGEPPAADAADCHRAVALVDEAYRLAGRPA